MDESRRLLILAGTGTLLGPPAASASTPDAPPARHLAVQAQTQIQSQSHTQAMLKTPSATQMPSAPVSSPAVPPLDAIPPLPRSPSPGRPGDFDFLTGEWQIQHWRLPPGAESWDHFEGEATCWSLIGGVGHVEELRIPARGFSGLGLRLLDVERRQWSDFWVNARSGVLSPPGLTGSFEQGAGLFWAEEAVADPQAPGGLRQEIALGVWDRITPASCRWRQAVSADGGRTWAQNWIMHWRRRS